jgi:hypothetical protein
LRPAYLDLLETGELDRRVELALEHFESSSALALLAARLYAEAGAPETAMAFLEARLRGEQSVAVRRRLEARYHDLWVPRDLARIDAALAEFERERGRPAGSIDRLVDSGLLIPEPRDRAGEAYFIEEGRAATRFDHETLRIYRQGGGT